LRSSLYSGIKKRNYSAQNFICDITAFELTANDFPIVNK
jgi:hypothetical protein